MRGSTLFVLLASISAQALAQSCTINSGLAGTCIFTGSCKSGGGTSEAGHCLGPTDIQCCTYGTCTASGVSGKCIPTGACSSSGGKSTPGLCPGPTDIQCCTTSSGGSSDGGNSGCSGGTPTVNEATLTLVEGFEGWSPTAYADPDGNPTIGWGHLCKSKSCSEIGYPIPLSKADGAKLLQSDMGVARNCITKDIKSSVKLNANQYGALCSWAFNVGCGNAGSSTLIKRLNNGESPNTVAAEELPKWNHGSTGVLPGLTRRRAAEVTLFKTANSEQALPAKC